MTPPFCNSTSNVIDVDTDRKVKYANDIVIEKRDSVDYEACHWIIGVEDDKYRDDTDGYFELKIESLVNAEAYIYDGTSQTNATTFIDNNATVVPGIPYRVPISTKLVLVMMTVPNGLAGSGSFSYEAFDVEEYSVLQQPFVGLANWIWYGTLVTIALLPFIICCFATCCCKKYQCCYKYCAPCYLSDCCIPAKPVEKKHKFNKVNVGILG